MSYGSYGNYGNYGQQYNYNLQYPPRQNYNSNTYSNSTKNYYDNVTAYQNRYQQIDVNMYRNYDVIVRDHVNVTPHYYENVNYKYGGMTYSRDPMTKSYSTSGHVPGLPQIGFNVDYGNYGGGYGGGGYGNSYSNHSSYSNSYSNSYGGGYQQQNAYQGYGGAYA